MAQPLYMFYKSDQMYVPLIPNQLSRKTSYLEKLVFQKKQYLEKPVIQNTPGPDYYG